MEKDVEKKKKTNKACYFLTCLFICFDYYNNMDLVLQDACWLPLFLYGSMIVVCLPGGI